MDPYIIFAVFIFAAAAGICLMPRRRSNTPRHIISVLNAAGFAYDKNRDCLYPPDDCPQKQAGGLRLCSENILPFNMVIDRETIMFPYSGRRWLIELRKGQYGISTGAEISVYSAPFSNKNTANSGGIFFKAADKTDQPVMSFSLLKNGRTILSGKARHWWLAAFKPGEFSEKESLIMRVKIKFTDKKMCAPFVKALAAAGYKRDEYSVRFGTVKIHYSKPHTPQPQFDARESAVQNLNKINCDIFLSVTGGYKHIPDKMKHLLQFMPHLYELSMKALYGPEFLKDAASRQASRK